MSDAESYDTVYDDVLKRATQYELSSEEATTAMKNLKILSECRPPKANPDSEVIPEPTTVMGKLKAGLRDVWDNETTRVFIKASGAFAGVALVTWSTIHRDHVLTRDALSQANQRSG